MIEAHDHEGLLATLDAHQHQLRRYLLAHGAGDHAGDLLQELRLRVLVLPSGPVRSPLGYLYRAATNLMIDYRRSLTQARERDHAWAELLEQSSLSVEATPSAERQVVARERLTLVAERLGQLPERARRILLRHRVDGLSQRLIASEMSVSQSTVESDLRIAYRWLDQVRSELDEEMSR